MTQKILPFHETMFLIFLYSPLRILLKGEYRKSPELQKIFLIEPYQIVNIKFGYIFMLPTTIQVKILIH